MQTRDSHRLTHRPTCCVNTACTRPTGWCVTTDLMRKRSSIIPGDSSRANLTPKRVGASPPRSLSRGGQHGRPRDTAARPGHRPHFSQPHSGLAALCRVAAGKSARAGRRGETRAVFPHLQWPLSWRRKHHFIVSSRQNASDAATNSASAFRSAYSNRPFRKRGGLTVHFSLNHARMNL